MRKILVKLPKKKRLWAKLLSEVIAGEPKLSKAEKTWEDSKGWLPYHIQNSKTFTKKDTASNFKKEKIKVVN